MEKDEYRYLFELEDRHWWFVGMRDITEAVLTRFLPRDQPLRILDAGCGTGRTIQLLRGFGSAFGIDYSVDAIEYAAKRGGDRLARASITALPFPAECFDLVTEFEVISNWSVADDRAAFDELRRVLKPGGLLHFREPAHPWLYARHDLAVHIRERYSRRKLEERLRTAGFEPIYMGYANSFLFPLAVTRRLLGNLLPRRRGSDVRAVWQPLNRLLASILCAEARWVRAHRFPVGLSHLVVARRPP